jgi:recombination protein RecA
MSPDGRRARLQAVAAALRRRFGPHIIRLGAEFVAAREQTDDAEWISTGSLALDLLLGGLPRGAITEYAGAEGAGTETLAFAALAACQRAGGLVLLMDAAGAADGDALAQAGVDLDDLALACPWSAAEAWEVLLTLCRSDALDLVLASLPDLLALRGAGGGRYRPIRVLTRLALALRGHETALLLTNRPMLLWSEEEPAWPTFGGAAMARAAALRLALRPSGIHVTPYGDVAALGADARVIRRRGRPCDLAVPLELAASGPRRVGELLALGRLLGCLEATPLGLATAGQLLGHTDARAAQILEADAALADDLERRIRAAWAECGGRPVGAGGNR